MTIKNLLEETTLILEKNGKSEKNVKWVGTDNVYFTWEEFKEVAKNTEYYSGYGSQKVAYDLLVAGDDFWLSRWEYDGSEGWSFNIVPKKPDTHFKVKILAEGMWDTLEQLHEVE